jgi:hypothetical protein
MHGMGCEAWLTRSQFDLTLGQALRLGALVEQQTSTPQYVVGPAAALDDVPRLYLALEEFLTFSNSVEGCTLLAQLRQDPRDSETAYGYGVGTFAVRSASTLTATEPDSAMMCLRGRF